MRKDQGFTIIEMLVACSVAGLLIIGIMTFLVNTLVNNSMTQARADLMQQAQQTLDAMTKDIRLSAAADENNRWADTYSPNAVATNGLGWESDADTLILATAAENSSGNVLFQDATHYITHKDNNIYYLSGGKLYKRILAATATGNTSITTCPAANATAACPADRQLVQNVTGFTLHYYDALDDEVDPADARSIGVTLTLQAVIYGRTVDAQYTTRTVFRNE